MEAPASPRPKLLAALSFGNPAIFRVTRMPSLNREEFHQSVIEQLPHLRAFAVFLTHDRIIADDLVQEAAMRALAHAGQFQAGTNFKAWITTILRNSYFNIARKRRNVAPMTAVAPKDEPTTSGSQEEHLDFRDFERAFKYLPTTQREALLLVCVSGFSYDTAAEVATCAVGTMKSRVARARIQLARSLAGDASVKCTAAQMRPRGPCTSQGS